MVLMKQRILATCPMRHFQEEDTIHVLQYQAEKIFALRLNISVELKAWLNSVDNHTYIISLIVSGLSSCLAASISFELDTLVAPKSLYAIRTHMVLG